MTPEKEYLVQRLRNHTIINPVTKCWLWTGNLTKGGKSEGYGRINIVGTVYMTHRVSAHIYHDMPLDKDLSKDYQALHICDNKACWNPDHLYVGNQTDNVTDRDGFCLAGKTECKNGHDLSNPDSYYTFNNQRKCKQCMKDNYEKSRGRG